MCIMCIEWKVVRARWDKFNSASYTRGGNQFRSNHTLLIDTLLCIITYVYDVNVSPPPRSTNYVTFVGKLKPDTQIQSLTAQINCVCIDFVICNTLWYSATLCGWQSKFILRKLQFSLSVVSTKHISNQNFPVIVCTSICKLVLTKVE